MILVLLFTLCGEPHYMSVNAGKWAVYGAPVAVVQKLSDELIQKINNEQNVITRIIPTDKPNSHCI